MGMGLQFHHRKSIEYSINKTAIYICASACNLADNSTFCKSPCFSFCPNYCQHYLESLIPSQSPVVITYDYHPNKSRKLLIIVVSVLSTTLFALLFYVIFVKFYSGWWAGSRRRSSTSLQPQIENEIHDDFLDHEDHGPVVDHHIWYINTVGLQPSIISAITVCKYKKGDGLVEGTVCSVCLSEFQDDETLRLLPNCSHAFHVPCIDTWLRSHTNCPLCRAPIVKNAALASSSESNSENSGTNENSQVAVLVNNRETERELEDGVVDEGEVQLELTRKRSGNSDDQIQPIRRSVSLDCVSISKMIQGRVNLVPEESIGNSDTQLAEDMKIVPKKVGRTESLRKFVGSSSIGRSLQNTQFSLQRSFSCSAKYLFSRPT